MVEQRLADFGGQLGNLGNERLHCGDQSEHDLASGEAREGRNDTVDHLGTEGVAPARVVEGDDANLSEDFRPDDGALEATGAG